MRLGNVRAGRGPSEETPFRILVLGDFGGAGGGGAPVPVDADTLDAAMERMRVRVALPDPQGGEGFHLELSALAAFHPDSLLHAVPGLRALADLRAGLLDPAQYERAAPLARAMLPSPGQPPAPAQSGGAGAPSPAPAPETDDQTLERLLGRPPARPAAQAPAPAVAGVDALVRQALGAGAVIKPDAERDRLVTAVEDELARRLRATLRAPAFRAVEAAWRGLDFLARALETGPELQLFALDIPPERLAEEAAAAPSPCDSAAAEALIEAGPWGALAALDVLGPAEGDAGRAGALAALACTLGAPLVAAADLAAWNTVNVLAPPEPWTRLRDAPEAVRLGLAAPGFMLRAPYGARTDAVETFAFEEISGAPQREDYLWGNPALLCACLLGQAFTAAGWNMEPGDPSVVDDLPCHAFRSEGESRMTASVERRLSDREAERLLSLGIMPVLPGLHANSARVARFQSLSQPPRALRFG